MEMTTERWEYIESYGREVFGAQDAHLAGLMDEAIAAGLPDIAVNAEIGRLLMMLTSMTPGRLAVEVGTLAGYSGIWLARGLAPGGRLVTIEKEPAHAEFAARQFERAGVSDRVEIRVGAGLDVLPTVVEEFGPGAADVVFLDAVKSEYADYWEIARPLVPTGGLVLADNVFGAAWWEGENAAASKAGMDRFNRMLAADPEFEAVALPIRSGVLIGRRMR
jgi:caffeoyl-CoA O-methyltransferase